MAVKLEKSGDSHKVNLRKGTDAKAVSIHVNLTWKSAAQGKPVPPPGQIVEEGADWFGWLFGRRKSKPAPQPAPAPVKQEDLDLGCMWLATNGAKSVVQALGKNFGSKDSHPYIALDGDDRSGGSADGENLYITRPDVLKRILIFAYIYEGSAFANVEAKLTLKVSNGETIEIELDAPSRDRSFCAAALIEVNGGELTVRKENKYFAGHKDCDAGYSFGFNWTTARKD